MHTIRKSALALATAGILLAPLPAMAASDYLLKLEGVDGEAATTIEVQSWSWGATQSTSGHDHARHAATGSPPPADGSLNVVTAREAGSGLATGRSSCPSGKHFPKANVTGRGQGLAMQDVIVTGCEASGMTITYRSATPLPPVPPPPAEGTVVKSKSNITNN